MSTVKLGRPRINHLAFTVSPDVFEASTHARIASFLGDTFGFKETELADDLLGRVMSFQWGENRSLHDPDQLYLVLIANDRPYAANPGHMGDHFGLTLSSIDEYNAMLGKAKEYAAKDSEVVVSDRAEIPTEGGTLHRFYVRLATPFACEVQYFEAPAAN